MCPAESALAAAPARAGGNPAGLTSRRFAAAVAGLAAGFLVLLTLAHPSTSRLHTWPWALCAAALWLLPLAGLAWIVITAQPLRLPAGRATLLSVGLFALALAAIASAWASPFSDHALARVGPTLGGVSLFFLVHHWLASAPDVPQRTERLARIVTLFGAALIVASLANWLRTVLPHGAWNNRNAFPFGHSTYTGGSAVLVLPWLVWRAGTTRGAARIAWTGIVGAALAVLASTSSRGAVIAVALMGIGAALVALRSARWSGARKGLVAAGAAFVALAFVLGNPRLRDLALHRQWSDTASESNRQRSAMFAAGVRLGAERPLLGWGPGTVPLAFPRVRATLDGGVDNVLQLHNTPIQLWATLGAAGVLAATLIFAGTARLALAVLRRKNHSGAALAAVASTLGYGVFLLTDHQLDVPFFAAFAATNLAVFAVAAPRTVQPSAPRRTLAFGLAALALTGPLLALGHDLLARQAYETALRASEAGQGNAMLAALDRATRFAPHDPFFQHQATAALLRESEHARDPARRAALRRAAIGRLEASLEAGVHAEFAHFNLGWIQLELGAPREAARHFRAAAALVPDKGGVYFGLGLALQELGERDAAIRAFALEWLDDPRAAFSPAWEIPSLAPLRPAVRAEALRLCASLKNTTPAARAVEPWFRWWLGERVEPGELAPGFNQASAAFAAALPAIRTRAAASATAPWARLYTTWRGGGDASAFSSLAAGDSEFAAALARRAARHREDFREFLAAGTEDDAPLVRTLRRARTGYGVLALHPDGPPLTDVYIVQENRVLADFAAELFPAKGWLPGRFLLALLPPEPR